MDGPKKCPECRGPISMSDRNRAIERVVAQIQLPCKWAADSGEGGCDFEGTKDPRNAHEQTCEFRRWPDIPFVAMSRPPLTNVMTLLFPIRFECPVEGCQATMISSEMCAHIESAHPDHTIKKVTGCFQRDFNGFSPYPRTGPRSSVQVPTSNSATVLKTVGDLATRGTRWSPCILLLKQEVAGRSSSVGGDKKRHGCREAASGSQGATQGRAGCDALPQANEVDWKFFWRLARTQAGCRWREPAQHRDERTGAPG